MIQQSEPQKNLNRVGYSIIDTDWHGYPCAKKKAEATIESIKTFVVMNKTLYNDFSFKTMPPIVLSFLSSFHHLLQHP